MRHLKTFKIFESIVKLDKSFVTVLNKIMDLTLASQKEANDKDIEKIIADLKKESDLDTDIEKIEVSKEGEKLSSEYVDYTKKGKLQRMKISRLVSTLFPGKYTDKSIKAFVDKFKEAIKMINKES